MPRSLSTMGPLDQNRASERNEVIPHLVGARRNSHQLRNMSFPQLCYKKPECPENSRIKKSCYNHKKGAMDVDTTYKQCNLYITDIVLCGCGNCPSTWPYSIPFVIRTFCDAVGNRHRPNDARNFAAPN